MFVAQVPSNSHGMQSWTGRTGVSASCVFTCRQDAGACRGGAWCDRTEECHTTVNTGQLMQVCPDRGWKANALCSKREHSICLPYIRQGQSLTSVRAVSRSVCRQPALVPVWHARLGVDDGACSPRTGRA